MKPLPTVVLRLLETLPEETTRIVLNTNCEGRWVVETYSRYVLDEPGPLHGVTPLREKIRPPRQSRTTY